MCIIAVKPYGVSNLDMDTLKNCFENNPDGAGYAFSLKNDKAVTWKKGFMSWKAFENSFTESILNRHKLEDLQLLLHFRITTHGGTRPENTHPFPVSNIDKRITSLKGRTDVVCAMNGITQIDIPKKSTFSDTMQYVKDVLYFPYSLRADFFRTKEFPDFIKKSGAKWAIMDTKSIETFGEFNTDEGWTYSNYSYSYSGSWAGHKPYTSGNYIDDYSLEYTDECYEWTNQLEFEGIILTDEGKILDIDAYDDVLIGKDDNLYRYSYTTDKLHYITNVSAFYDMEYKEVTYKDYLSKYFKGD